MRSVGEKKGWGGPLLRIRNPGGGGGGAIQAILVYVRTYLCVFGIIIETAPRTTHEPGILDVSDQRGAHDKGIGAADDASQAPAFGEVDRLLQTAGAEVDGGALGGIGEEEDGVGVLFGGEEDADFGAEGGEEDGAGAGEAVDLFEDGVDEVVQFYGVGVHAEILGFGAHGVFWGGDGVRVFGPLCFGGMVPSDGLTDFHGKTDRLG